MKDFSNEIRAYALKNAIEYGKADAGRVLTKLFQHGLEKKDIRNIMASVQKIVKEVNLSDNSTKEKELLKYGKYAKERKEEEKTLPELPNTGKGVVTRLPPEPSKYLHLGHGLSFLINSIYAEKYNGKCHLRFEDANPEKVSKEYADAILDDIKNYLKIKLDKVHFVSDDIETLYEYAETLVEKGNAYMCFCEREKMQDNRHNGKECECRRKEIKENKNEWELFIKGEYKEGEAVLRLKGDMQSLNHVMRDPVLFRAVYKKHFRKGKRYKVWPTYDFYNPIEDSIMKVTHILRSNEFEVRTELHEYIKKILKLQTQTFVQYGRFNVIGAETKGREIREMIESGDYIGWDDPRLITLRALKRRGIRVEILRELVNHIGLSKKQISIDFDMIAAISRKILDKKTERYYFVENPTALKISGMPEIKFVNIKTHPEKKETRKVKIGDKIFISERDYRKLRGKEIRLMSLFNLNLGKKAEYIGDEIKDVPKVQWVSEGVRTRIMMPDGKWVEGIAEEGIKNLDVDSLIQFERFGFARLDRKTREAYEFWFAHR